MSRVLEHDERMVRMVPRFAGKKLLAARVRRQNNGALIGRIGRKRFVAGDFKEKLTLRSVRTARSKELIQNRFAKALKLRERGGVYYAKSHKLAYPFHRSEEEVMLLPDISTDFAFVLRLAGLLTRKQLDPAQLLDVIEDLL